MPIFSIMLRGENFEIIVDGMPRRLGFFATRFVRAQDEAEAERVAVAMVKNDEYLKATTKRDSQHTPMIYLESVGRRPWWQIFKKPQGFTFWNMDEESSEMSSNVQFDADAMHRSM